MVAMMSRKNLKKGESVMNTMERGPGLRCRPVEAAVDMDQWESIAAAFSTADSASMGQSWRDSPDERFRPASVRTAWTATALLVYAVLDDEDIFNPVTTFNALSFQEGDVFEIFLRPVSQDAYFEFHVSPCNQQLQLRMPSGDTFAAPKAGGGIPGEWFIGDWRIESRVRQEPEHHRWSVFAAIPLDRVAENSPVKAGDEWLYSFSRYDYTRGQAQPVHSSTSPHKALNFHRQEEWGRLVFEAS